MGELTTIEGTFRNEPPPRSAPLTSGSLLARNVIWNLIGNSAPMLVAFFSIPLLIQALGKERFGVLTLVWALVGYVNLFDFGLGRALTQLVANKLGSGKEQEVSPLTWTSLLLMSIFGIAAGVLLVVFCPFLVGRVLNISGALQTEALHAFYILSLSIPFVITTTGLRGLLEAHQRFDVINLLRIPMGVFSFAGPLLVLPFSKSLVSVVAVIVGGRLVAWAVHLRLCVHVVPTLRSSSGWWHPDIKSLLRFGGWMTVTNTIGPLMVTFDKFLIGALVSMTAVTYYSTPYEVVTKLWLVPGALIAVMFPAFSTSYAQDLNRTVLLFDRAIKVVFLILLPVILLLVLFAKEGFTLWLGADFASHSSQVLHWLAVGVFINSLALVPFTLVQGLGRPDVTAKLHLLELPVYMIALWWLVSRWGIEGAAIAWTARVAVDALALFILACRHSRISGARMGRTFLPIGIALIIIAAAGLPVGLVAKTIFLLSTYLALGVAAWFWMLSLEERTLVLRYLK